MQSYIYAPLRIQMGDITSILCVKAHLHCRDLNKQVEMVTQSVTPVFPQVPWHLLYDPVYK